jgi:hypothetical protein
MKTTRDYYEVDWKLHFKLDSDSPTGLSNLNNKPVGRIPSKKAKSLGRIGWMLSFNSGRWLVHRIIAILNSKEILNNFIIDHLDGNPYNNNIKNIRVTSQKVNTRNRRKQSNNISGITGIGFYTVNTIEYVIATIKHDGKTRSKSFNLLKLGEEAALELAINWREDKLSTIGDYTERHGK